MSYDAEDDYKGTARFSIKSFKEKMNKLKREIKETEDKMNGFKDKTSAAKWREHNSKQKMKEIAEKISDAEEQIRKIEGRITYHTSRSQDITERYRENGRVVNTLEHNHIDLEQMMRELQETQQHCMEVRRMNKGLLQVVAALEPKIESAERREQKALDRVFLIKQKLTIHHHLASKRPEDFSSPEEDIVPQTDQEAKILQLRAKIKGAILRRREAEKKHFAMDKKKQVMEEALENYRRRNLEFQVSKRELLSSNFY